MLQLHDEGGSTDGMQEAVGSRLQPVLTTLMNNAFLNKKEYILDHDFRLFTWNIDQCHRCTMFHKGAHVWS
jgi:hypothetical protein